MGYFIVEPGAVAVWGSAVKFELNLRERRQRIADNVWVAGIVGNDEAVIWVNFN